MKALEKMDFRRVAEQLVEKVYISDPEWKEMLVETYQEMLEQQRFPKRPLLKLVETDYFLSL